MQTMLSTFAQHLTPHTERRCNARVILGPVKVFIAAVVWITFSCSRRHLVFMLPSLTPDVAHMLFFVSSPCSVPIPFNNDPPTSSILISPVCCAQPPQPLCFRPLRLAPGNLNLSKPSFSVFCCKYSHSGRSLSCMLASRFTVILSRTWRPDPFCSQSQLSALSRQ